MNQIIAFDKDGTIDVETWLAFKRVREAGEEMLRAINDTRWRGR